MAGRWRRQHKRGGGWNRSLVRPCAPKAPGMVGDTEAVRGRVDREREGRAASWEGGKDQPWAQEGKAVAGRWDCAPPPHLFLRPFPGPPRSLVLPASGRRETQQGAPARSPSGTAPWPPPPLSSDPESLTPPCAPAGGAPEQNQIQSKRGKKRNLHYTFHNDRVYEQKLSASLCPSLRFAALLPLYSPRRTGTPQ